MRLRPDNEMVPMHDKPKTSVAVSYFYDTPLSGDRTAPIQILKTCRALCDLDVSVTVYCRKYTGFSYRGCLETYAILPCDHFSIVPIYEKKLSARRLRSLVRDILADSRPGMQHYFISRGESGIKLAQALRGGSLPKHRFVYELHRLSYWLILENDLGMSWPKRLVSRFNARVVRHREAKAVRSADGLVALTGGVLRALKQEFKTLLPSTILPSGTNRTVRDCSPSRSPEFDVIYCGKLRPDKGIADLIQAMQFLPESSLCVLGGVPSEVTYVNHLARTLGVNARIHTFGQVPYSAVGEYYSKARVGVVPLPTHVSRTTDEFTSPMKLLEMMSFGLPVVATDIPVVRNVVENLKTAVLVPPNNPKALAAGISTLLCSASLSSQLVAAARIEAQRYSWDNRAIKLMKFLNDLS